VPVVAVADDERERTPERTTVAEAREDLYLVGLDLLARRAPVALLAAPEVGVDRLLLEDEAGRQARDDRDERRSVRLSRGGEVEGHGGERSALEAGEHPRAEARLPVPRHREEKPAEPPRLMGVERDRGLGLVSAPDAEASVLRLGEVDRDAEAAVADVRMA